MTSRLNILKSDLKDLKNPKFLQKYPHLDNPKLIKELELAIEQEEALIKNKDQSND